MQYANVLVDKRLSNISALTYSIPSDLLANISIGQLCEVPIGSKMYLGVIESLTRSKPKSIIKPISKIVSLLPIISKLHLDLYKKIAISSLSSINDVLFYFLPGKITQIKTGIKNDQAETKGKGFVKILSGTTLERFEKYHSIIQKYQNSKSLLIIFPDYIKLNSFAYFLTKRSINFTFYHGSLTMKKRWEVWTKINNIQTITLSTRIGLGLIPKGNAILIIDDPTHPGYLEDQRPRFSVSEIVKIRRSYRDNIILGSSLLPPTMARTLNLQAKYQIPKLQLIQARVMSFVEIVSHFRQSNRVLISAPKKGEWGLLICKNCSSLMECPKCHQFLCQIKTQEFFCYNCNDIKKGVPECANCASSDFAGFGMGLETIKQNIGKLTNKKILIVDKNNIPTLNELNAPNVIVVSTTQILDLPVDKFDLAVLLNYDGLLNIPIYNQEEKIFNTILSLSRLASNSRVYFRSEKSQFYSYLIEGRYLDYIKKIISDRSPNYPPFKRCVDLIVNKTELNKIQNTLKEIQILDSNDDQIKIRYFVDPGNWLKLYQYISENLSSIEAFPDPIK